MALLLLCLALAGGRAWSAHAVQTPHVDLRLLAEPAAPTPGETLWLGLDFRLIPHWHVYWRNPGDSGEAPRVDWRLPEGWRAGEIQWPVPARIPVGPLVNYGYADQVTLLVPIIVGPLRDDRAPVHIGADVRWLVCREECIPEAAELSVEVPMAVHAAADTSRAFETARSRLPVSFGAAADYRTDDDGRLLLHLRNTGWSAARIQDLWFASHDWGPVASSGPQSWRADGDDLLVELTPGEAPLPAAAPLSGLLVVTERTGDGLLTRGFELAADGAPAGAPTTAMTLLLALGLAFVGGLLLNLMPCVLPVLSIKVLGLVRHAAGHGAGHGLAFLAGVLLTFSALAGLLLGLRASGAVLGWGFQLQEPLVVIGLLYLMLAVALNLSGAYSIGGRLAGLGQGMTERPGYIGTFATGVLAVIVASPCTAPFMGAALGYALARPALESLLVFLALGAGFAAPLLVLSIWPRWLRLVPPPGAWMERLRNLLAFPMYAAAAWLLWVLSQQVDAQTLAAVLGGALLLAFALWWHGQRLDNRPRQLAVVVVALSAGLALGALAALDPGPVGRAAAVDAWSAERVQALRRAGRPVLVNFTAAWCITCKVNEQVALRTEAVHDALQRHRVAYLKGDWTRRDAAITAELQRHGRSGVPLYLLFPAGDGPAQVLPQLLTEGLVVQAIERLYPEE